MLQIPTRAIASVVSFCTFGFEIAKQSVLFLQTGNSLQSFSSVICKLYFRDQAVIPETVMAQGGPCESHRSCSCICTAHLWHSSYSHRHRRLVLGMKLLGICRSATVLFEESQWCLCDVSLRGRSPSESGSFPSAVFQCLAHGDIQR
jgi:hypothetical protein